MIAIIDYGVGNLFSLKSSLARLELESVVTADPAFLRRADRLILPGVGAFGDAAEKLRQSGLAQEICALAEDKPLLGICLGMQLLFEKSSEYGEHRGLGLLEGEVRPLLPADPALKIPHMGWNALRFVRDDALLAGVEEGSYVYFLHSFCADRCDNSLVAVTDYGETVTAAVRRGNVMGTQFHPEKSGRTGLAILRAFAAIKPA